MNILLGLTVGLLLVYLLAYTDFVLTRKLKERIAAINQQGRQAHAYRPLNWPLAAGLALLFWVLPILLLGPGLYLEYRVFLTLVIWGLLGGALYGYLFRRTGRKLARQTLVLLLAFALACGLLLGPILIALKKMLF